MRYCAFTTDGAITKTGFAPELAHEAITAAEGGRVLFGTDPVVSDLTHYVENYEVVLRPTFPLVLPVNLTVVADGNTEMQIGGVPNNTLVKLSGPVTVEGTTHGEDVILTFAIPGRYILTFNNFPYLDQMVIINAT